MSASTTPTANAMVSNCGHPASPFANPKFTAITACFREAAPANLPR
jgi:hypothetical protein